MPVDTRPASNTTRAIRLLDHYLTTTMRAAGLKVDGDTHVEIEEIVDALTDAAIDALCDWLHDAVWAEGSR